MEGTGVKEVDPHTLFHVPDVVYLSEVLRKDEIVTYDKLLVVGTLLRDDPLEGIENEETVRG